MFRDGKKCAHRLAHCYISVHTCTEASLEFAHWLVATLNVVIVAAQKRGKPDELNQERLWRKFNLLTVFDSLIVSYQHFTEY